MIPTEDVLDALDLSRAEPGIGFLEALYTRFLARVPFENATKILRNAEVADPAEKPRRPEVFWADHLESGSGGTCFARVAAFEALLTDLGFPTRRALGRVGADFDHSALLVERDRRRWLCDVGFPLPALVPAEPGRYETPRGALVLEPTERGLAAVFADVIPEGTRRIEIFDAPVSDEDFERHWRATFRAGAHFLKSVSLRIEREGRVTAYAEGAVRVEDLHTRLTIPLPPPRAARLSEIFGIDRELLSRAFAVVGEPPASGPETLLTAYLETAREPDEAFGAIATASGYRALLEGVARVAGEEETAGGFRLRLEAPGGAAGEAGLEEEVSVDRGARRVAVLRRGAAFTSATSFRAETREGRTWLIREASWGEGREDLLRNDALRGRLAGALAVDLLAWARLLPR